MCTTEECEKILDLSKQKQLIHGPINFNSCWQVLPSSGVPDDQVSSCCVSGIALRITLRLQTLATITLSVA
jgi:hypothetical protein